MRRVSLDASVVDLNDYSSVVLDDHDGSHAQEQLHPLKIFRRDQR